MSSLVKGYSLDYDSEVAEAGRRVEFDISMTDTEGERCTSDTMRLREILQEKDVALEVDNKDSKGTYTVTKSVNKVTLSVDFWHARFMECLIFPSN